MDFDFEAFCTVGGERRFMGLPTYHANEVVADNGSEQADQSAVEIRIEAFQ